MKTVGVRELKNRLSEYIRHVRAGESVLVTDRGEVVAELTPPGPGATAGDLPRVLLGRAGRGLAPGGPPGAAPSLSPALPRKRNRKVTAAQLLEDERGTR